VIQSSFFITIATIFPYQHIFVAMAVGVGIPVWWGFDRRIRNTSSTFKWHVPVPLLLLIVPFLLIVGISLTIGCSGAVSRALSKLSGIITFIHRLII